MSIATNALQMKTLETSKVSQQNPLSRTDFRNDISQVKNTANVKRSNFIYEYKVEFYKWKEAEERMNALAAQGWRVVAVTYNDDTMSRRLAVTYERKVGTL